MEKNVVTASSELLAKQRKKALIFIISMLVGVLLLFFISFLVGTRYYGFAETYQALFGFGDSVVVRVVNRVRLPRAIAAVVVGAGLAISGLIMQTCLKNPMASPSTMGVSNAATLGANLAILFLTGSTTSSFTAVSASPYAISAFALLFALICTSVVLALSSLRRFSPTTVVLVGVAMGSLFQALVTLLQYFADDVQLSTIVSWTFGDLERMSMGENGILGVIVLAAFILFFLLSYRYNALSGGENFARSLGVRTSTLRFVGLFVASLITAVAVSFVGIIGFVGIIAPHICKRIVGSDHRFLLPASALCGSFLLLFCDIATRLIGQGIALPVGAITAIIGAPFFIFIVFSRKEVKQ
ncbi:MAG: iron ABC transporter permease [Bacillota bacterium]|nr:iron ABC transporter permease [Bacillota bacterium]